jgi:photosystem II stability/assembly factor-like uncharacterized protein
MAQTINDITFDFNTQNALWSGNGDLWPVTWGADGNVWTAWGDGSGFGAASPSDKVSIGFGYLDGHPIGGFSAQNVWGGWASSYPTEAPFIGDSGVGKPGSILSLNGNLYCFVSMQNGTTDVKLIYSTNNGANWTVSNVVFDTSTDYFWPGSFFQMGQNNSEAFDEYIYFTGYDWRSTATWTDLFLGRVHRDNILNKASYEYYVNTSGTTPQWTTNPANRLRMMYEPNDIGATAIVYNSAIDRYMMTGHNTNYVGKWTLYEGENPWGPWYVVKRYTDWNGYGNYGNGMQHSFPAPWMSEDGLTVWMVFSGETSDGLDQFNYVKATLDVTPEEETGPNVRLIGYGGGGWFRSVRFSTTDTNKIYLAGDRCGVYTTANKGLTWTDGTGILSNKTEALTVHPTNGNIAIVATDGGAFQTTDGGASWNYVFSDIAVLERDVLAADAGSSITAVEYSKANTNIVFAGSGGAGYYEGSYSSHWLSKMDDWHVYWSTNGGANWTIISSASMESTPQCVYAIEPSPHDQNIVFVATSNNLYKGTFSGTWSWETLISSGTFDVVQDPNNSSRLFRIHADASSSGVWGYPVGNIYRSDNGGSTWTQKDNGMTADYCSFQELRFDPSNDTVLYAGNRSPALSYANQMYKTTDGGENWTALGTTSMPSNSWHTSFVATAFDVNDGEIVTCQGETMYTGNDGATWTGLNSTKLANGYYQGRGNEFIDLFKIVAHPGDGNILFGAAADFKLCKSIDGGTSWDRHLTTRYYLTGGDECISARDIEISKNNSSHMFLCLYDQGDSSKGMLLRSLDGGETWSDLKDRGLPLDSGIEAAPSAVVTDYSGNVYTIVHYQGIYKSTNNGDSWAEVGNLRGSTGTLFVDHENNIYAGLKYPASSSTDNYGLWKSTDQGATWNIYGYPNLTKITDIHVDPQNANVVWVTQMGSPSHGTNGGVWKSVNGGQSFTRVLNLTEDDKGYPVNYSHFEGVKVDPQNQDVVFACTSENQAYSFWLGQGIWRTTDGGSTWAAIDGIKHNTAFGMSINAEKRKVYACLDQKTAYEISMDATGNTVDPIDGSLYAPSSLQGTVINGYSVRLNWVDNSTTETGFEIYDGGTYVQAVGANVTELNISPVTTGVHYFRVRAFTSNGYSSFSNYAYIVIGSNPLTGNNPEPATLRGVSISPTAQNSETPVPTTVYENKEIYDKINKKKRKK